MNPKSKPATLVTWASLWSLVNHPAPTREWSLRRKFAAAQKAGFDGVNAMFTPAHVQMSRQFKLRALGTIWQPKATDFAGLIAAQKAAGVTGVNVMFAEHDTPFATAFRLMRKLYAEAARQEVFASIEIHRDTAPETPEKLFALADKYERQTGKLMPVTWDFSHWGVVKQLPPSSHARFFARPGLVQNGRIFHLRPFNASHAQIPTRDRRGRETAEFREWLDFIQALMELWLRGPQPGGEFNAVLEFGPIVHGYQLTTFPSAWEEACFCRESVLECWKRASGSMAG
jgi:hypothetical protein